MTRKRYPTTLIDAMLWNRFMDEIARRKGVRRGMIGESLEEAIQKWIEDGKGNPRQNAAVVSNPAGCFD